MKKIIVLLISISFLFQSCYSYRSIDKDLTNKPIGKIYKIKQGQKTYKGKLLSSNDSITTLIVEKKEITFKTSEIVLIKQRKLSVIKTVGFSTTMFIIGIVGLFVATYDGPKVNNFNAPN